MAEDSLPITISASVVTEEEPLALLRFVKCGGGVILQQKWKHIRHAGDEMTMTYEWRDVPTED